jgi:uncharacterized membrane protein
MRSAAAGRKVDLIKHVRPLEYRPAEPVPAIRLFGIPVDLIKTGTYLVLHLLVGFTIAYLLTGSVAIAGGIALIEPLANAVVFYFHEKAWRGALRRPGWMKAAGSAQSSA